MTWPDAFKPLANTLAQPDPFLWLVEIQSPDGGPVTGPRGEIGVLRLTPNPEPVVFGSTTGGAPITYYPWPIRFDDLSENSSGDVPGIRLTFSNIGEAARAIYEGNDFLRNHLVFLHLVHSAALADTQARYTVRTGVVSSAANDRGVTLVLAALNMIAFDVPQVLATRTCRWVYRGPGCFFTGDPGNAELGPCKKTLAACRLRGAWEETNGLEVLHPQQFGGHPAYPVGVAYVTV